MGSVSRRDPILLPAPQRLRPEQGAHRLRPGRLIHVTGGERAALLRIGAAVRDALAAAGASWQLTAHGGPGPEIGATVAVDPARVSRAQGYLLTVGPERIDITGHDEAGAFYGAMTLRQIARQARDGVLPCLRIADHPDIAHRGLMLDISRDRVPTMETLFGLVDLLSEWKVNQLQLYTEHTFAYRDHREVWADWSPMTGEQVMELDAYCRDRYVELVANQNTFGHLARWMVHPRYRPLCEDDDPAVFLPHRGLYGTLCPTDPGSIALVDELLEELLPHFTSRQVHIGCDEARIGLARSRRVVEERGAGPVYLDYVRQVHELVRRRGRTTQLWGDVLISHPELAAEFPVGAIPVMENYSADAPFDTYAETCVQAGLPFYLSSGINCWSTIIGNTATAVANIRRAGESAVRHGAAGVLNTHWGDNGHWQHLPVAFPGLRVRCGHELGAGGERGPGPAGRAGRARLPRRGRGDGPAGLRARRRLPLSRRRGRLARAADGVDSHRPARSGRATRRADRGGAGHGRGAPGTGDGATCPRRAWTGRTRRRSPRSCATAPACTGMRCTCGRRASGRTARRWRNASSQATLKCGRGAPSTPSTPRFRSLRARRWKRSSRPWSTTSGGCGGGATGPAACTTAPAASSGCSPPTAGTIRSQ